LDWSFEEQNTSPSRSRDHQSITIF